MNYIHQQENWREEKTNLFVDEYYGQTSIYVFYLYRSLFRQQGKTNNGEKIYLMTISYQIEQISARNNNHFELTNIQTKTR